MTATSIHNGPEATITGGREQAPVKRPQSASEQRRRLRSLRKQLREGTDPSQTTSIPRPHESPRMPLAGSSGSRLI